MARPLADAASGRKLWWSCPFHEDTNPSFCVEPGKGWWKCFGCGESGDAAALVMRLEGMAFPEAVAYLIGGPAPTRNPTTRPAKRPTPKPPLEPSGLPEADALVLVEAAAVRLWTPEGANALAYLTGPRCLTPETIRSGRFRWTPGKTIPTRDGDRALHALGVVIPWFNGNRLCSSRSASPTAADRNTPKRFAIRPALSAIRVPRRSAPAVL